MSSSSLSPSPSQGSVQPQVPPGSPVPMVLFNAAEIIGPIELGVIVSMLLYGCALVQAYVYFSKFKSDPLFFKLVVFGTLALELGHGACVSSLLWTATISTYGHPQSLAVFPYSADVTIIITILVQLLVQGFFIYRLAKLCKMWLLPGLCIALCIGGHGLGFYVSARAVAMTSLAEFRTTQKVTILLSLILDGVRDVAVTAGLVFYLWQMRRQSWGRSTQFPGERFESVRPEFHRTVNTLDLIVLWTVETGLITTVCDALVIVFFLVKGDTFIWVGIYIVLGNIYANSLLAALNSRLLFRSDSYQGRSYELEQVDRTTTQRSMVVVHRVTQQHYDTESGYHEDVADSKSAVSV